MLISFHHSSPFVCFSAVDEFV